jgi:hypothetical protein
VGEPRCLEIRDELYGALGQERMGGGMDPTAHYFVGGQTGLHAKSEGRDELLSHGCVRRRTVPSADDRGESGKRKRDPWPRGVRVLLLGRERAVGYLLRRVERPLFEYGSAARDPCVLRMRWTYGNDPVGSDSTRDGSWEIAPIHFIVDLRHGGSRAGPRRVTVLAGDGRDYGVDPHSSRRLRGNVRSAGWRVSYGVVDLDPRARG